MAASFVVLGLAAGCVSQRNTVGEPTASGEPQPSASVTGSSAPGTLEQNKQAAEAEAKRLLALAPRPPGAKSVRVVSAPGLAGPAVGAPMTTSLVDQTEFWQVPMSGSDSLAWLASHSPTGMKEDGGSSGSDSGGVKWSPTGASNPGVVGQNLQIGVANVDESSSVWRIDAIDEWLDPIPYRDDTAGRRMRVTVAGGCPSSDEGEVGVSNEGADLDAALLPSGVPTSGLLCDYNGMNGKPSALTRAVTLSASDAARLATAANASRLSHLDDEHVHCPSDDGSLAVLAFSYLGRADVDVAYYYTGCPRVANGHITATPSDAFYGLADPLAAASSPSP